jgi:uncharacterized membrane protein YdjX (TVP38/TMEM64 family)
LAAHKDDLSIWVAQHQVSAVFVYLVVYFVGVAFSLPGAVFMTLAGGMLFGTVLGAMSVVFGATTGAVVVFLVARYVGRDAVREKLSGRLARMEKGFQRNAFHYLLVLRLVPIFPFWLVNLAPALLGVRLPTFVLATLIGIVPGALVYASVGNGIAAVLDHGGTPDLNVIWSWPVIAPLLGVAALSLLPVVISRYKARHRTTKQA